MRFLFCFFLCYTGLKVSLLAVIISFQYYGGLREKRFVHEDGPQDRTLERMLEQL